MSTFLFVWNSGHGNLVEILLENGADANIKVVDGKTPLYVAALNGHGRVVEILLENGADISIKDNWGSTPFSAATESGNYFLLNQALCKSAKNYLFFSAQVIRI